MEYLIQQYPIFCEVMGESPLPTSDIGLDCPIYRLWWLPAHYRPLSVHMHVMPNGSGQIRAKVGAFGRGGTMPAKIMQAWEIQLSSANIQAFFSLLHACDFWQQPTQETGVGLDGSHWVLEGYHHGHYHVVDRWQPQAGPFREACLLLMKLVGLELHGGKPGQRGTWFALKDSRMV